MEKELIIIAIYINVTGMSHASAQQAMNNIISTYENMYNDINTKSVKTIFLPIKDGDGNTRVECIYPVANINNSEVESQLISLYKAIINSSDEEIRNIAADLERKIKLIKIKDGI